MVGHKDGGHKDGFLLLFQLLKMNKLVCVIFLIFDFNIWNTVIEGRLSQCFYKGRKQTFLSYCIVEKKLLRL